MGESPESKRRLYSSRPWTASQGRSPLAPHSQSSALPQSPGGNNNTVEALFPRSRRQRKAAARHAIGDGSAPTIARTDTLEAADDFEDAADNDNDNMLNRQRAKVAPTPMPAAADDPRANGAVTKSEDIQIALANPTSTFSGVAKGFSRLLKLRFRNRVADASSANAASQADFRKKFGLTNIIEDSAELEEFRKNRCKYILTKLVVDGNAGYFYYWIAIVSIAYVYNLTVAIARAVFVEVANGPMWIVWLCCDIVVDIIYFLDMFVRSRTGFLDQGLLVRDIPRIKKKYLTSKQFKLDIISFLPIDYIFLLVLQRPLPILRLNRLLRKGRIKNFLEQTETRSSLPNAFRVSSVVWYIAIIIHWNACFYFLISEFIGLGSDGWVYGSKNTQSLPSGVPDTIARRYIYSFYWSTLILTTIGEVPGPTQNIEFMFVTLDLMCGVLIFATIVGNVGTMISNMSAARTDFQNRMDGIKQFMELRRVGKPLEVRVIKWFDYLWDNKQSLSDQQILDVLPDKLQAEIAMHVHFETLRKVRIFQDCEAGLLAELVLKLKLQVFSPNDYICRKGDIGREMYIVKRGKLEVVADDGRAVFTTLMEGAVFGELSILNISGSKNGNRRTANVRSVGYTDLFVLNKTDLWSALKEYPDARRLLIQKGREILRKDNLLDENAPEETRTAEEMAEELHATVKLLQMRIARLLAERINTDTKLTERIAYLEKKLAKYERVSDGDSISGSEQEDDDSPRGDIVEELVVPLKKYE